MKTRHLISAVAAVGSIATISPAVASADTTQAQSATSANWSGYVAGGSADGSNRQFSSVSGSWTEPSANCASGQGYASFWVGLGGSGGGSGSLEQVGTETNCSGGANANHFAWYELVPAGPVRLDLSISPGDHLSGRVTVSGSNVTVSLTDQTTGASATKTLQMSDPDVSTAEWIAEAPSACDSSGNCQPVPLADFGSVGFTGASATADGHTGPISDPNWTAQPVELASGGGDFVSDQQSGGATPSDLGNDGSSFSVTWAASSAQSSDPYADGGPPGYGYAYGYGPAYG